MLIDGINLIEGSAVENLTVTSGATLPSSSTIGELFFKTSDSLLYVYDGSVWTVTSSPSAPGITDFNSLNVKGAARVASTGNLALNALQTVDGVALVAGDRVLVKNQTVASQNGVYIASASIWARAEDFDGSTQSEVKAGDFLFVTSGTANASSGWLLVSSVPVVVGTTSVTFTKFTSSAQGGSGTAQGTSGSVQLSDGASGFVGSTIQVLGTTLSPTTKTVSGVAGDNLSITAGAPASPTPVGAAGGSLTISAAGGVAGSSSVAGAGGDLTLAAGGGSDRVSGPGNGGSIAIKAGTAGSNAAGGAGGSISFSTAARNSAAYALTERLRITNKGAWSVGSTGADVGVTGQILTSNGDGPPTWQDLNVPTSSIKSFGSAGTVQVADGADLFVASSFVMTAGALAASANMVLQPAAKPSGNGYTMTISGGAPTSSLSSGGATTIIGGAGSGGSGYAGDGGLVTVAGGNGADGSGGPGDGGSVVIKAGLAGSNAASGKGGNISFFTAARNSSTWALTERLRITELGAWQLNTNAGTAGQVLTSNGSLLAPTWQAAGGGSAAAGTLTGTTLASNVVSSSLTSVGTITSGTWSGSFGAVSGANLTTLNASNLSSGMVGTGRLGTGTASGSTYLRGDGTWSTVTASVTNLAASDTIPSVSATAVNVGVTGSSSNLPALQFYSTVPSTGNKSVMFFVDNIAGGDFFGRLTSDAGISGGSTSFFQVQRSGLSVSNVALLGSKVSLTGLASGLSINGVVGTSGQVLTSNGTAAPTWQDAAGGSAAAGTLTGTTLASNVVSSSLTSVGTITSGTWSGSFGAVSGVNLTSLNASNLTSGTVGTARLGTGTASGSTYLRGDGTWSAISASATTLSATDALGSTVATGVFAGTASSAGVLSIVNAAATSGNRNIVFFVDNVAGGDFYGRFAADNSGLSGSTSFLKVQRSGTTSTNFEILSAKVSLTGLASGLSINGVVGTSGQVLTSNGAAAPTWQSPSAGSVAASALTGTTLASNVVSSSLTSVGTITSGTWSGSFGAVSGANLTTLNASNLSSGTVGTARLGTGTADSTTYLRGDGTWAATSGGGGAADASTLTGTTLASNVVSSSLTSVGTLTRLSVGSGTQVVTNGGAGVLQLGYLNGATTSSQDAFIAWAGTSETHNAAASGTNGSVIIKARDTANAHILFATGNTLRLVLEQSGGTLRPGVDNSQTFGSAARRWNTVYAGTGSINTSDENLKEQIVGLDTAEAAVAVTIKGLFKKFKFKDAVAEKGAAARWHVGVIAQEVQAAFTAEGLDAAKYALFCSDTWYELDGNVVDVLTPDAVEVTRLGIRYDQLLAFVISAM